MFSKTTASSEDESNLTEERVLAILAPFDAEQAYNWGEEHPKYRKIVGQSISKDTSMCFHISNKSNSSHFAQKSQLFIQEPFSTKKIKFFLRISIFSYTLFIG